MTNLTITIPSAFPIICPICGERLLQKIIHVYCGLIFCRPCVDTSLICMLDRCVARSVLTEFNKLFICYQGLCALCPDKYLDRSTLNRLFAFDDDLPEPNPYTYLVVVPESTYDRTSNSDSMS